MKKIFLFLFLFYTTYSFAGCPNRFFVFVQPHYGSMEECKRENPTSICKYNVNTYKYQRFILFTEEVSCSDGNANNNPVAELPDSICIVQDEQMVCITNPDPAQTPDGRCNELFVKDGVSYTCNPNNNEATPIPNSDGIEYDPENDENIPKCNTGYEVTNSLNMSADGTTIPYKTYGCSAVVVTPPTDSGSGTTGDTSGTGSTGDTSGTGGTSGTGSTGGTTGGTTGDTSGSGSSTGGTWGSGSTGGTTGDTSGSGSTGGVSGSEQTGGTTGDTSGTGSTGGTDSGTGGTTGDTSGTGSTGGTTGDTTTPPTTGGTTGDTSGTGSTTGGTSGTGTTGGTTPDGADSCTDSNMTLSERELCKSNSKLTTANAYLKSLDKSLANLNNSLTPSENNTPNALANSGSLIDGVIGEYTTFKNNITTQGDTLKALVYGSISTINQGFNFNISSSEVLNCPKTYTLEMSALGMENMNVVLDICEKTSLLKPYFYPLFLIMFSIGTTILTFRMLGVIL